MTLKEKFENVLHNWIDKDYNRQHVANELEIDTKEFAIGFAKWIDKLQDINYKTHEQLLEIYKKEKGL
jgi:hypothetical protein